MPKWIYDLGAKQYDVRESSLTVIEDHRKIYQALAIAWEALESIDKHQAIVSSSMSKYSVTRHLADEALNRIRALGGEEGE